MTHPLLAWVSRMQAYARQPIRNKTRNIHGGLKFDARRCNTCPRLEHCQDFPQWKMGHHPEGRCPDGVVEKILPQEIPGEDYFQPKTKHDKVTEWWQQPSKRSQCQGVCLACYREGRITYILKSRLRLCRSHAAKFVAWRRRQTAEVMERKRERYIR